VGSREFFESLDSTQRRAVDLARAGAPTGTTVVASTQTDGTGRLDHRWHSPRGGLYLSILVDGSQGGPGILPLAIGLGLRGILHEQHRVATRVLWPNDLVVAQSTGRAAKIAGILVDRIERPGRRPIDVAGIGINANTRLSDFPQELRSRLTTLREETGSVVDLAALERGVVRVVTSAALRVRDFPGRSAVVEQLSAALYGVGEQVTVDGRTAGRLTGVEEDGALLVEADGLRTRILAGSIAVGSEA